MVVLRPPLQLAVHLAFDGSLQASFAAAAIRTANLDSIHGGHHSPAGPVGAQHAVALQLPSGQTTEIEHLFRGLAWQSVADGVLAQRSDPFLEYAVLALGLEAVNGTKLTGRSKEHRIERLRPGMRRILPAFRHGRHRGSPVEGLVEIALDLMAAQRLGALLPAEKAAQVEVGNLSGGFVKALSQFYLGAHLVGQFGRNVKGLGFTLDEDREDELGMKLLTLGATARGFAALPGSLDEGAGKHLA